MEEVFSSANAKFNQLCASSVPLVERMCNSADFLCMKILSFTTLRRVLIPLQSRFRLSNKTVVAKFILHNPFRKLTNKTEIGKEGRGEGRTNVKRLAFFTR